MISREDIKNLAELSRLKLSDAEMSSLEKEFGSILDYVGHVSGAVTDDGGIAKTEVRNVMREDAPRVSDLMANKQRAIIDAFPRKEDDYLVVRKIIQKDE